MSIFWISVSMVACVSEETVKAEEKVIALESIVQESVPEEEADYQMESIKPPNVQEEACVLENEAVSLNEEKSTAEQTTAVEEEPSKYDEFDALKFKDDLKANLKDTEYADIEIGTTGKTNTIWIVDEIALKRVVNAYEGVVPEFEVVFVSYSKQELSVAVEQVESDPHYIQGVKDRKISSVSSRQGYLDIILNEPYPEFEKFIIENYDGMARIKVIGVNPET